ncbi:alpha-amylase family glycosyl hydrolase [Ornithinibacillus sp. FSL M8-0202]|uniref:alpha-amylase family glycosyl hydrolase n=1 Tax=Ornithinibacillus sp. FSL M8-0202 TaxID=2921616 RepID=UPI0030CCB04A
MKKIASMLIAILVLFHTYPAVSFAEEHSIQEEIIYDILVDRFNNGNQAFSDQVRIDDPLAYHGGDIKGIMMKLDDIKKLGFTAISLSPIMANAKDGYHGYWVEDFYSVEPQFGTMEEFQEFVQEAHNRDIKVMLELVINYVANSHPIVTDPNKQDWIVQQADIDTSKEPWLENVAVLNQDNPEVQAMLIDVAKFWMNEGNVDGFILHAADQASPEFLETLTTEIKAENPNIYMIANVLGEDVSEELTNSQTIDAVDNPALSQTIADVFSHEDNPVEQIYTKWEEIGSKNSLLYVDNKTLNRFTQVAAENKRNDINTWKLVLVSLMTTPGVPILFQGSEVPMYGAGIEQTHSLVNFNSGEPDLEEVYTKALALRNSFPALQYGDFELVGSNEGMSVMKRTYQDETMYIAINNDSVSRAVSITDLAPDLQLRGLLGDNLVREINDGEYKLGLARETADVFIVEENTGINWGFVAPMIIILLSFVAAVIYLTRKQRKREATE